MKTLNTSTLPQSECDTAQTCYDYVHSCFTQEKKRKHGSITQNLQFKKHRGHFVCYDFSSCGGIMLTMYKCDLPIDVFVRRNCG